MKHSKLITWISAAALGIAASAALSAGMTAEAATGTGTTASGYRYTYDTATGKATITGYTGSADVLMIPANANGYSVNKIGDYAFAGLAHSVRGAYIPSSIREIGVASFYGTNLTSVSVPANVEKIDRYAFANCRQMTTLTIKGETELRNFAFYNCTALSNANFNANSFTNQLETAFYDCPSLTKINGVTAVGYLTEGDKVFPYLKSAVTEWVSSHFRRSTNVKFVNDYCTALCNFIVATETEPWMSDMLKARQLHDWLVRHCEYEDARNGETLSDSENHVASSVFLSYTFSDRGPDIGESVCEGYSKAYTMLLAAAGIESYPIYAGNHEWNLIKADGRYYEVDVTWDDPIYLLNGVQVPDNTFGNIYKTDYTHFLKSDADMVSLHGTAYASPRKDNCSAEHPLLNVYTGSIADKLAQCTASLADTNADGILDYDYDLDGTAGGTDFMEDQLAYQQLRGQYGNVNINNKLAEVFYRLHQQHHGFWG